MSEKQESKITIELEYPIKVVPDGGSERSIEVSKLEIGRIKSKHLRGLSREALDGLPSVEDILALISRLTGLTEEDVDDIDVDDLNIITEKLLNFLVPSQTTGEN